MTLSHRFLLGVRHMLLHAALCYVLACLLGVLEVAVRIAVPGPGAANEFVGICFVLWAVFTGPLACLLAAPAHLFVYIAKKPRLHWYSFTASLVSCVVIWTLLWALSRYDSQAVAVMSAV